MVLFIDCIALAKQGGNGIGNIRPSVHVFVTLQLGAKNDNYPSQKCVYASVFWRITWLIS